jgi:N-sulfoglucosamine sulfohydrolase
MARPSPPLFAMTSLRLLPRVAAALLLAATPLALQASIAAPAARPNILWITCEDSNPHLGSYGDTFAVTPTLDALAGEGVRYTQAFAYTGVCAPSRSCLITGVYPLRLGSHHMRSTTRLPAGLKCFPEYLRQAGYYTSNNVKQDYNFVAPKSTWDDSSNRAHWRNRAPGQPFFSVFNFTVTHQSQIFCDEDRYQANTRRLTPGQRRDPAKVPVPPIHPDTPEFRREWARHYENVTAMDYQVADLLAELEHDGLAGETIVFFFSDHGTGMPGVGRVGLRGAPGGVSPRTDRGIAVLAGGFTATGVAPRRARSAVRVTSRSSAHRWSRARAAFRSSDNGRRAPSGG